MREEKDLPEDLEVLRECAQSSSSYYEVVNTPDFEIEAHVAMIRNVFFSGNISSLPATPWVSPASLWWRLLR